MGFFANFKELFNKNIECGEDLDSHILVFLKRKKYLYLGKNIIVRDNSVCVVTHKGRICDVLLPGKYKISKDSLTDTFDRAKVDKLSEKGIKVKKIKVKLYYINTSEMKRFEFSSNHPFSIKSKDIGKVKGCFGGVCDLRVIDPQLFVKALLSKSTKLNSKIAKEEISNIVGNKINKIFEKSKLPFEMMFSDRIKLCAILNSDMEDALDKSGVFVKNIQLRSIDVAKKHQQKVNEYIASHKMINSTVSIQQSIIAAGEEFKIPVNIGNSYSSSQLIKTCPRCGKPNSINSSVCQNCSNRLN